MVSIVARRGNGDYPGEPVVEPLLGASTAAALTRAADELDERSPRLVATLTSLPRVEIEPGDVVRSLDLWAGPVRTGIASSVTHRVERQDQGVVVLTTLTVREPLNGLD